MICYVNSWVDFRVFRFFLGKKLQCSSWEFSVLAGGGGSEYLGFTLWMGPKGPALMSSEKKLGIYTIFGFIFGNIDYL